MKRWQAIIFDLDDTLYPERSYVWSGFGAVAHWAETRLGIPSIEGLAELQLIEQGVRGNTFNRWVDRRGIDPETCIREMIEVYRKHTPNIAPFAEVPQLLQRLNRRYRLGIVSDGYRPTQQNKLAALGLSSYFQAVVISDESRREARKPSPQPFQRVMAQLKLAGSEAVYVADNPQKDFVGARSIGMGTVRYRCPQGLYCHFEPPTPLHAPDAEIETLDQLEIVLG